MAINRLFDFPRCKRRSDYGVTLLEVLIVMIIVLVIAAALLAVFPQWRSYSLQTECAHRMKQLGVAFHLYAGEHDNYLPTQTTEDKAIPGVTETKSPGTWTYKLYPYVNSYFIMACPTSRDARVRPPNSYYYNAYVAQSNTRVSASKQPSKDALLIDQWSRVSSYARFTTAPQRDPITETPGSYFPHPKPPVNNGDPLPSTSSRRPVLFVDGHVAILKATPEDQILTKHWTWPIQ